MAAEVGNLFVSLGLSTANFDRGVKQVQAKLDQFGRRVKEAGGWFSYFSNKLENIKWGKFESGIRNAVTALTSMRSALVALGVGLAAQRFDAWTRKMAEAGEASVNMSEALGVPIGKLVELQGVMMLTEGTLENANVSIRKISNSMADALADATGDAANTFKQLGISLATVKANENNPAAMLEIVAKALAKVEDGALKNEAVFTLLGKSYQDILPLLRAFAGGYDKLVAQWRELNPSAEEAATKANDLATEYDKLSVNVKELSDRAFVLYIDKLNAIVDAQNWVVSAGTAFLGYLETLGKQIDDLAQRWENYKQSKLQALMDWWSGTTVVPAPPPLPGPPEPMDFGGGAGTPKTKLSPRPKAGGGKKPKKDKEAESRVSAWQDELEQMLIAERKFFGNSDQMELDFWRGKLALTEQGGKEWLAIRRKMFDLEKSLAQQAQRDALRQIDHEQQINDARLEQRKLHIQQAVDFDRMTEEEGAVAYQDMLDQKWEADAAYYAKKIEAAAGDDETQKELYQKQLVDYQNYLTERDRLQGQTLKIGYDKLKSSVEGLADVFKNSFGDAFDAVVEGTFKVKNAIGSLLKDLGKFMANEAFKSLFKMGSGALTTSLGGLFGSAPVPTGDIPGAQHGGSFRVGGAGGIDSKLVAFRASPGETVNVRSPLTRGGGGGEVVRIELNPSEGWVAGVADQQIKTRSGQIVQVAVRQSQSATKRQFNTLQTESAARQA